MSATYCNPLGPLAFSQMLFLYGGLWGMVSRNFYYGNVKERSEGARCRIRKGGRVKVVEQSVK
jgi:hypothetical protein